jgi:hypothetical protein
LAEDKKEIGQRRPEIKHPRESLKIKSQTRFAVFWGGAHKSRDGLVPSFSRGKQTEPHNSIHHVARVQIFAIIVF